LVLLRSITSRQNLNELTLWFIERETLNKIVYNY
jgi:hypothetical protein